MFCIKVCPVTGSSFFVFSKTMKLRIRSRRVFLFNIPCTRGSSWLMSVEASVFPSEVFHDMKRLRPADIVPARASRPSEINMNAL